MKALLDQLKFDANGLIPVSVQDVENGQVLVMAYTNRDALEKTIASGKVHTYSRSRGRIAVKGESSGHFQHVKEVRTGCDRDAVLIKVVQEAAPAMKVIEAASSANTMTRPTTGRSSRAKSSIPMRCTRSEHH